jgi:putative SOS response-associated peptidase YedK
MCYSAQIRASYKQFTRMFGATLSIHDFAGLFWQRTHAPAAKIKIPKAMEAPFLESEDEALTGIRTEIQAFNAAETQRLEQEVFAQRKRLADAERALQTKVTKAATESRRIATAKVDQAMGWLDDLRRIELEPRDARIFPGMCAPVMVVEDGELVILPMRYQCRPEGKPAFYDTKYPATYNARRDNLQSGFWKYLYGYRHGIMLASSFFENVKRHRMEGRELREGEAEENVVLEFRPDGVEDMLVACLWSRWRGKAGEPDLLSFAAITDEPPAEVSAAGHDRCIIPIKRENVGAWLRPDPKNLAAMEAILDDRERPYYQHQLAA